MPLGDEEDDLGGAGRRAGPALAGLVAQRFKGQHLVEGGFLAGAAVFQGIEHADLATADAQGDERVGYVQAGEVTHVAVPGGVGVEEDGLLGGNAHDEGKEVCLGERPHLLSGP